MKQVNFAVVGAGLIGTKHIAMINNNTNAKLCAVCDVRSQEQTGVSPEVPYYSSLTGMLAAHPEVEVVNICTPNALHASMAIEALESGRNVVIEKPLAISVEEARQVAQAERKSGKTAFMVMQNRYSPPSKWIKEVMDKNLLGEIFAVNINCMWNRDDRYYTPGHWHGTQAMDGGTLYTQFSHFIDILYWLLGDVGEVKSATFADFIHSHNTDFEDTGTVLFSMRDKALCTLTYTTAVWGANLESSLVIVGSKGSIKIAGQYMNEVVHCNIEGYEMPTLDEPNKPNDYGAYKGSAANHCYVIQNVVETLNGLAAPTATVDEGIAVVDIIERIYSHKEPNKYGCTKKLEYQP